MADYITSVPSTRTANGVTTFYDALGTEITEAKYNGLLALIAASGGNATPTSIVGNVSSGTVSNDDPAASTIDSLSPIATADNVDPLDAEFDLAIAQSEKQQEDARFAQAVADSTKSQKEADVENDWRVRLHLAPSANYLYKAADPGILAPLTETNGIIFPYTPQIQVQYSADYENYDLVHSNYKGYFYKGSKVENVIVTATFTANDVKEANYMLAAMHFLKSATKMFYGQDTQRGMPPPVLFLTGLGEYQFNNHPCAITSIHFNLPNDVDYIPCGLATGVVAQPMPKRASFSTSKDRLSGECTIGGYPENASTRQGFADPYSKATYMPTKIDVNFSLIPIQTRDQVSRDFSLRDYASGKLLTKGFW